MPGDTPLDGYIPVSDARERYAVEVDAPAALVFRVAEHFDLQSIRLVRAIFGLRTILMRAKAPPRQPQGFFAEMQALGWGCLASRPGELFIGGAACQPWLPEVKFRPIPASDFAEFAEPGQVKIAWTVEAQALGPARTRLATETRAVATDPDASARFRRYWRWARFGIIPIRWLLLPAIRREAERQWRVGQARGPA
jgi:hypothetical protein